MTNVPPQTFRRVEHVMGTAFSIWVGHDGGTGSEAAAAVDDLFVWLRWVDRTFSTYRADSEVSRLDRGELGLDDASSEVREVLVSCADLCDHTEGWFTAWPHGDGRARLDPSGFVKGWSIDRAATMLRMAGFDRFAVNGGGDIVCGAPLSDPCGWRVGVRHPGRPDAVAAVLALGDQAVATSGTYERGAHLWGRAGSACSGHLSSVTVVGPELGTADALATALFAEGSGTPDWSDRFPAYERLVITTSDRVRWTSGLDDLLSTH